MEKKLSDYLHLYLGCEVSVQGEERKGYLTGVTNGGVECEIQYQLPDNPHHLEEEPEFSPIEDVKPILRPLASMTEEEMQECGNMVYDFSGDPDLNKWEPKDFEIGLAPEQFHWLLSKGFDLFNLIPEGLALDATQQPLTSANK